MDLAAELAQALSLHQVGRLEDARVIYDRVLAVASGHAEALHLRGAVDLQQERYDQALGYFDRALAANPDLAAAHANRASALLALGRFGEGLASCDRALATNPAAPNVWANRAALLIKIGRPEKALASAERALLLASGHIAAVNTRTEALRMLGRWDEALASAEASLALQDQAEVHAARAAILLDLKRPEDALAAADRALASMADTAQVHGLRANALARLHRAEEAIAAYDRALTVAPGDADLLYNRAAACVEMGRLDEALTCARAAQRANPAFAPAHAIEAAALRALERYAEAVAACDAALARDPALREARLVRGLALEAMGRPDEALPDLEAAGTSALGASLLCSLQICKWDGLAAKAAACLADIDAGGTGTGPFAVMALEASPRQQQAAAGRFFAGSVPAPDGYSWPRTRSGKLKVGYFSADFFDHATSRLATGLFEEHDRAAFEVIAFAFGNGSAGDSMRARLEKAFDRFIDVTPMTPRAIVASAREMGLHIAVDLKGLTKNGRPAIFALGAAPIQVNYLGYPGSIGSTRYDYVIGDRFVTPPDHAPWFSEHIVTLPHSYQANDAKRARAGAAPARRALGLPERGFVFASFNNNYKITPTVFDIWMRLLKAVDGSVLWQLADNAAAAHNLRAEASARGVDPARLVFAPRAGMAEHLARHRAADLFLDTFPCNAHTTASDALWAGLPVLTRLGGTFTGRVAAGLVAAAGMPELITRNDQHYEALALALARSPDRLAGYRERLENNRLTCALFDTRRFTRHLEAAYREMWAAYESGRPPAPITVSDRLK